jgi:hypothetical protein
MCHLGLTASPCGCYHNPLRCASTTAMKQGERCLEVTGSPDNVTGDSSTARKEGTGVAVPAPESMETLSNTLGWRCFPRAKLLWGTFDHACSCRSGDRHRSLS